ncbi:MAG: BREX-1 system phosphatase PglZ type A, partial [Verrucomicrobiaceae bacterium]
MSDTRIHSSLQYLFQCHRLVFWYDARREWETVFEGYENPGVTRLRVADNEFGTKVRIVRDPDPGAKFLIYVPSVRPPDAENWLLDLLYQGYEYKADKASLAVQEAGLEAKFRHLAEEHATFFSHPSRVRLLKERLAAEDEDRDVRLKMMAVLAGTEVEVDAMLLGFLKDGAEAGLMDPVAECFDAATLTACFWREVERAFGYKSATPSLRDFAVSLFRAANPLEPGVTLHSHAKVFLQRWKDSQTRQASYILWANHMERELRVRDALEAAGDNAHLGDWDTFAIFEKSILHRLCQDFSKEETADSLRTVIQGRRTSFWHKTHEAGYAALEHAVELRELLAAAELSMDSLESGIARYTARWWRIDMAYRLCIHHLRRYHQVPLMERISQWVEKTYVNNFLLPLSDRWSDWIRPLERWGSREGIPSQRRFFETWVRPFLAKGQKVFVIVSDALRYEAAADFAQRMRLANRWTAEVEPMLASLPSYTQLGMASLLPGGQWSVDPLTAHVTLDGRSATGTPNRSEILNLACGGKGIAVQAEEFLEMNTKTAGRALMRDHEVIYIFHNLIDKTGDALATEARTFDAVETAFTELEQIMRKVANINGSNMLLTADHGFLFQQDEVEAADITALPTADEWFYRNRRFALGRGIQPPPAVKI